MYNHVCFLNQVGDFNYLGSVHHNADRKDEGKWEPQDPSVSQLRQSITEYCILPNGSAEVREAVTQQIKSVMLYGPAGAGKTHAVEAVANELGALLLHLTPAKLKVTNIFMLTLFVNNDVVYTPGIVWR